MEENMNMKSTAFPACPDGVRKPYLRPEVEVYVCEPQSMIAKSKENNGGHSQAGQDDDIDDNPIGGGGIFGGGAAKEHREISFSNDLWEE